MTERLLYMEDDAAQARLVQKCLERAGYAVDVVSDGRAGLAQFAAKGYDAVIVDQTMPGLSGLEVIHALAATGPLPPTIMVTGTGNEQIAVEAMKLGVNDYLVKDLEGGFVNVLPLVVGRTIEQRRTLVEKQRMEQELAQAQKLKAIGQLAAGIAHEINTPTQYIGDNTRFLQDAFTDIGTLLDAYDRLLQAVEKDAVTDQLIDEVEAKQRGADLGYLTAEIPQALQQSLEGVQHVAGIVGAIKEFAHPGSGPAQTVDLNHAVEGAITLCRNEWKCVAEVATDFDPGLPPVSCLPSDIHRAVVNLVVNAAHAVAEAAQRTPPKTRDHRPHAARRGVGGNPRGRLGHRHPRGHPRPHLRALFHHERRRPRQRARSSPARAVVVEKHAGTIHFETQVGRGTTFIVRLPIRAPEALTMNEKRVN